MRSLKTEILLSYLSGYITRPEYFEMIELLEKQTNTLKA